MDSTIIAALISGGITLIGYYVTNNSTGKQLEDHKKRLESRDRSYNETMKIFEIINTVAVNINDGLRSSQLFEDEHAALDKKYKQNSISIPESISQKIATFIYRLGKYTDCLSSQQDLKRNTKSIIENKGQDELDRQQEKISDKDKKLRKELIDGWIEINKEIKDKFEMFN